MKELLALIAIVTLLPLIVHQAYSQQGTPERTITFKITNTKTGTVTTKVWSMTGHTFGERFVDVPDFTANKIKRSFYTDSFSFTQQNHFFVGKWLHFDVEMIGTPLVGTGLTVKFI